MRRMMVLILTGLVLGCMATLISTTSMAAEQAKPVTLRWSLPMPEKSWFGPQYKWWASELEKRTGGRVAAQIFWMESLTKLKDALPAVQNRFADMAHAVGFYHPSNFPLMLALDSIYNCNKDYVAAMLAGIETIETEPNLRAEMEREKVVQVAPYHGGAFQMGFKKCINSVKELKGMSIRTMGGVRAEFLKQLGANPVNIVFTDTYEAVSRGMIQAWADAGVVAASSVKLPEVAKCLYMINSGTFLGAGSFMNLEVFRGLPQDVQQIILNLRKDFSVHFAQSLMDTEAEVIREWETKFGVIRMVPSPEDEKILFEAGRKANEIFVKQQESAGHTAAGKVLSFYMNAMKKYEDERARKK